MALVDAAERVVLGDTMQYSRQSYQNRSRARTPQGWQWLSIPLAGNQHGRAILDVAVHGKHRWARKHWRALHYNYRTTPFFDFYEPELVPLFDRAWERLGDLTCTSVVVLARLYGIDTPILRASEMDRTPESVEAILEASGGGRFLSAADTADVDGTLADVRGVLALEPFNYRQNFEGFEPGMSALDLLFNYGPDALPILRRRSLLHRMRPGGPLPALYRSGSRQAVTAEAGTGI